MINKSEFCFKSDSYLPSEIRDEMVSTFHSRVLDVEKIIGFLTRLPKDADITLNYREAIGDWGYIFGKKERGNGKNVLFNAQFTVGAFLQGMKFGYASVTKAKGTTGALESDIIGKSLLHFFETGERLVACPDPKVIADALMDSIMHSVRTSTEITDTEWREYHEKYVEDMLISLGMARRDLKNSRFRWCVTDAEMRVGLVEIVRKQIGAIGLIVSRFPDEWKRALDILRKEKEKLLDVQDGKFEGKMLKDDWDCIQAVRNHVVKKAKDGRLMLYVGRAGTGKAMPKDTRIPTPDGEKLLGEIKVGDFVFDRKGHPTKVLEVYDRGVRRCFELTFSDGRKTRCCDEHMWSCYTSKKNLKNFTLKEMMEKGIRISAKSGGRFRMPINGCVEFAEKELPVHPYILGVFLGDGCCTERYLTLSSNDRPVVEKVAKLLNATAEKQSEYNYSWSFMKGGKAITTKEVFGDIASLVMRGSNEKAIPADYLHGSRDQRIALLQGLFDTDGSVSSKSNGMASFYTTSSELYSGVSYLLRSLGLPTSTSSKEVCRGRIKQDGTCSTDYVVRTHLKPDQFDVCFSLPRQIEKLKSVFGAFKRPSKCTEMVALTDVREIEPCEQVCILVDNPEHLFLANDFLVTHNTYRALGLAKDIESAGKNVQWSIVTLSNNVGAQGSVRAKKDRNLVLSPFSIARCHYQKPTKYVIIDEFSQWGQESIGVFRDLLEESEYLLIMGDDRQMNSFLGKGSLLYDVRELLLKECPGAVMSLTEIKRQKDNPELGEAVLKFAETGDPNVLEKWIYKGLPSTALNEWCDDLHRDCIIVTGSNANVNDIGRRAFRSWLYSYAEVFRTDEEGRRIGNLALKIAMGTGQGLSDLDVFSALQYLSEHHGRFSLPVIMSDNVDLTYMDGQVRKVIDGCTLCGGFGAPSRKFLRSEKATITGTYDGGYIVENFRGGIVRISLRKAQHALSFGFAITVDKAQGNEWRDVMVFMPKMVDDKKYYNGNLLRANAFYVAVSRPREKLIIVPSGDPISPFEEFTNSFNVQVLD